MLATACGGEKELNPVVTVRFAQPFPAAAPDLQAFPVRDQGHYSTEVDSTQQLIVTPGALLNLRSIRLQVSRRQWDSLARAHPECVAHWLTGSSPLYRITPASPDSLWLSYQERGTLLSLRRPAGSHLRRYRGRYYLSTPASEDSTQWQVRRLTLLGDHYAWASFNPDSLRLRALAPATVQLRRRAGRLFFTLNPAAGPTTRQVHGYAGLWLPE